MHRPPHSHQPSEAMFHMLSPVVVALALVIVGIELIFQLGDAGFGGIVGLRSGAVFRFGVHPELFRLMFDQGIWDIGIFLRLLSHLFIQHSLIDAIFNAVLLLSLGKFVGDILAPVRVLVLFLLSGAVAALAYVFIVGQNVWLISAHTGVYGLLGAYTFFLKILLEASGQQSRQAFTLIMALLGIQLFFQVFFGGAHMWVAMLAGFGAGFVMAPLVLPGGLGKLLLRMRRDD